MQDPLIDLPLISISLSAEPRIDWFTITAQETSSIEGYLYRMSC